MPASSAGWPPATVAPVQAVALDDEAGLRSLLADAAVVINCAGPFTAAGDGLVRAAVATRTHYVDSTGEQPFIRAIFERHGPDAERAGVALVPALGFDYAPGDCIAHLTARGREPLAEIVVAYAVKGFGASRGTMRSTLDDHGRLPGGLRGRPAGATSRRARSGRASTSDPRSGAARWSAIRPAR